MLSQRYSVIFTWFWRLLGNSLESSDLEGSINGPKEGEKEPPIVLMMLPYGARARARMRVYANIICTIWRTCFLHFNVQKPPSYKIP